MYHWSGGNGRDIQNLASPHHTGDTYKWGNMFLEKKIHVFTDDGRLGSHID